MNNTTKADCIAEATKHGAEVQAVIDRTWMTVNVDLPAGRVWMDSGCHVITEFGAKGHGCASILYQQAIEAMQLGTTECDDDACEVCPQNTQVVIQ